MTRNRWLVVIAGEILTLCCCAGLFGFVLFGSTITPSSTAVIVQAGVTPSPRPGSATLTPAPTQTFAATNTFVVQPKPSQSPQPRSTAATLSPTRAGLSPPPNLYRVVVPTPTASALIYPIAFLNSLAVVTYPVTGTSLNEISQSLDTNALADPHQMKGRYYARTDWYMSANWTWKETPRGCEVEAAQVSIVITMTLPALSANNVGASVLNRWTPFIENTIKHESGHVKIALDGARDYQRDLGNFPPAANCTAIQPRLRDVFDRNFAAIDRANVRYDADTQHGVTQGASFP